jgi:4-diphosphocytidyl-2-C-methyl-D-erythritol kinase
LDEFAPAKVNLALHVVGRRLDGYHLLDSLVVFAGVGDTLSAVPADALTLEIDGPHAPALESEADNLVLRAARLLAAEGGVLAAAHIRLHKRLPVASGIGGGSADAAAALRLLARLWRLEPLSEDLAALALRLGADVPACLASRPSRMRGIGECLDALGRLPNCGIVLANPGIALPTPSVFAARAPGFSPALALAPVWEDPVWEDVGAFIAALAEQRNDLEAPARSLAPAVGEVLSAIASSPGALLARMSGSGATCFGMYATPAEAAAAASTLARPGWWVWGGPLAA